MIKCLAILLFLAVITSCKKEEEILTGDIAGIAILYDQHYYVDDIQSGALVNLIDDHVVIDSAFTDENGHFVFADVEFGTYFLDIKKEKYVPFYEKITVHHIGGYSPTNTQCHLFEVPDYLITIDSITYKADMNSLIYHVKFNGDSTVPHKGFDYSLRIYVSGEPDVTSEHYRSMSFGHLWQYSSDEPLYGWNELHYFDANFEALKSGTIYLRIYPCAYGQRPDSNPEGLGKPSNVISFNWNDVVGQ